MPIFYGPFSAVRLTPDVPRCDPTAHLTSTVTGRPKEPLWNTFFVPALVVRSSANWSVQK